MKKKYFQKSALLCSFFGIIILWFSMVSAEIIDETTSVKEEIPVVVIDPGHGGHDIGVRGAKKMQEKSVTMAMAMAVSRCLEGMYETELTRNDDYWLDIPGRASIANHRGASLFLSIHTGGSFSRQSEGIAIYYYGHTDQSIEEPDAVRGLPESIGASGIPWDEIQNSYVIKSKILAETIQTEFEKDQAFPESKIYEAPIFLLSGIKMPCIVIEIGYLTNPMMEKKMGDKQWNSEFSRKICAGIDAFFKKDRGTH